jgi:hypothetical protein
MPPDLTIQTMDAVQCNSSPTASRRIAVHARSLAGWTLFLVAPFVRIWPGSR